MKRNNRILSKAAVFVSAVILVAALYFAKEVFIPLALSILLTFLLTPIVLRLQRWGVQKVLAVAITILISLSISICLTVITASQLYSFAKDLPQYKGNLRQKIQSIRGPASLGLEKTTETVKELGEELSGDQSSSQPKVAKVEIVEPPPNTIQLLRSAIGPLAKPLGTSAVVIVFVIFMLLHREDMRDRVIRLIGVRRLNVTIQAFDDAAFRVSRYLFMQFLINFIQGTVVAIGLTLIGVPNGILWGILTIAFRFIPYLGPLLAATMPILVSLAAFDNWTGPLMTIILVTSLEILSNNVLEPWLYGSRTGLSPVALIVAAVFWTWLWGGVGLLLSTPLTVCLVVMGKYIPQLAFLSILLSDEAVLSPRMRLYQRLLASDLQEAETVVKEVTKNLSAVEILDRIAMPLIVMTEQDFNRGLFEEIRRDEILKGIDELVKKTSEVFKDDFPQTENHSLILCVPARSKGDELASSIFIRILRSYGITADFVPVARLAGESLQILKEKHPKAVCLSVIPPYSVLHARYICKRIRNQFPRLPILAIVWNGSKKYSLLRARMETSGANRIARTAAEAIEQIRYFFPNIQLQPPLSATVAS